MGGQRFILMDHNARRDRAILGTRFRNHNLTITSLEILTAAFQEQWNDIGQVVIWNIITGGNLWIAYTIEILIGDPDVYAIQELGFDETSLHEVFFCSKIILKR